LFLAKERCPALSGVGQRAGQHSPAVDATLSIPFIFVLIILAALIQPNAFSPMGFTARPCPCALSPRA
jgi:ABC-type dipeptide/oligopeptide/nickel transport system permease subunit